MEVPKPAVCVLVLLSLPALGANAQCRIGSGPDQGDGVPYCSQSAQPTKTSSAPQWAVRWGAVAYGGGGFGTAKDMVSLAKAKKVALRACRDSGGGKNCKIALSYSDQCVAYAMGDEYLGGIARSPMPEEADAMAIDSCAESTTNCKVTYSACSLPVRIK